MHIKLLFCSALLLSIGSVAYAQSYPTYPHPRDVDCSDAAKDARYDAIMAASSAEDNACLNAEAAEEAVCAARYPLGEYCDAALSRYCSITGGYTMCINTAKNKLVSCYEAANMRQMRAIDYEYWICGEKYNLLRDDARAFSNDMAPAPMPDGSAPPATTMPNM